MLSGVPQGTVLGPLMFLLYINDIDVEICSSIRLFADDCILYRIITSPEDHHHLQHDLDSLVQWTQQWQMKLNPEKCVTLRCTRSPTPHQTTYLINKNPLQVVNQHDYLGVKIHSFMSWSHHIQVIINKATKMLNFVKRTLYQCNAKVKVIAYTTLVRPTLEYATVVWDPYQQYLIDNIEMVQRRAARWVKNEYGTTTSVTAILKDLEWNTLSRRRQHSRLTLFFKFLHQDPPVIGIPHHYLPFTLTHCTRQTHHLRYIPPSLTTTYYQKSFFLEQLLIGITYPMTLLKVTL